MAIGEYLPLYYNMRCSRSIIRIVICFDSLIVCLISDTIFLISKICPFDS